MVNREQKDTSDGLAMLRLLSLLFALSIAAAAAVRLYMKDGQYHNVREYKVEGDRVRYYSLERSDWEEIPLELVDLKRTEAEIAAREQERKEEAAIEDAEEKAERAQRRDRADASDPPPV